MRVLRPRCGFREPGCRRREPRQFRKSQDSLPAIASESRVTLPEVHAILRIQPVRAMLQRVLAENHLHACDAAGRTSLDDSPRSAPGRAARGPSSWWRGWHSAAARSACSRSPSGSHRRRRRMPSNRLTALLPQAAAPVAARAPGSALRPTRERTRRALRATPLPSTAPAAATAAARRRPVDRITGRSTSTPWASRFRRPPSRAVRGTNSPRRTRACSASRCPVHRHGKCACEQRGRTSRHPTQPERRAGCCAFHRHPAREPARRPARRARALLQTRVPKHPDSVRRPRRRGAHAQGLRHAHETIRVSIPNSTRGAVDMAARRILRCLALDRLLRDSAG